MEEEKKPHIRRLPSPVPGSDDQGPYLDGIRGAARAIADVFRGEDPDTAASVLREAAWLLDTGNAGIQKRVRIACRRAEA